MRAVVEIALNGCGSPLGGAEIARRRRMPERFLEQIFGDLRRAGVLESRRGAHGGYCFAMPSEEVTVLDIVEVLDGEIRPARCSAGDNRYMDDASLCATSKVWDEGRLALEDTFGRFSIARLAEAERESREGHKSAPVGG